MGDVLTRTLRHTGIVTAAALAASLLTVPPAFAAAAPPKVYARTPQYWAGGVVPVTFEAGQNEDLSAVTSLTLFADGKEIGTDTAAPWGVDWDTTGFDGPVILSTRATAATGSTTSSTPWRWPPAGGDSEHGADRLDRSNKSRTMET